MACGIRCMPTFQAATLQPFKWSRLPIAFPGPAHGTNYCLECQFYKNGTRVDEIQGAFEAELIEKVEALVLP